MSVFNNVSLSEASPEQKRICEMAFNQLRPTTGWIHLCPWRETYLTRKDRFYISGNLHQKHATDPLHLSLFYKPYLGNQIFFHINGYMRNEFIITDITVQKSFGQFETLCEFAAKE